MLSKLFKGELELKVTFWKFGIIGLIIFKILVKVFGTLLFGHLRGKSIVDFFWHYFNPIFSSKLSILWTLCYLSTLILMAFFTWNIILGVWRSSAAYDKSVWLSQLARIGILLFSALIWGSINFRPFF